MAMLGKQVLPAGPAALTGSPADRARFRRLFAAVMLPMFVAAVDQTLLATATPLISRELGGLAESAWIAVGYLLAAVVTVPLYGQLGDHLGRRRMLRRAIYLFALGSLGCTLAPTLVLLIAARVLQGLGGGGLMSLSQALIGEVLPPQQRARYQGYFAIIFTLASVGGPVIGGLVVQHASWRWLFAVNLPLCALALWRLSKLDGQDHRRPLEGRTDVAGLVLFAVTMSLTLLLLSSVARIYGWLSPTALGLALLVLALWALLARVELAVERRGGRPVLPIDLLRQPAIRQAVLTVIGFASVMFAMVFYLPIYLQLTLGSNSAEAGLQLLPLTAGIVCGSALTGRMIVWTGRPRRIPVVGLLFAAACLLALGLGAPDKRLVVALGLGTGFGLGCVMSVMQIVTQLSAGMARLGAAAASVSLARSLGASVGASAFAAIVFAGIDVSDLRRLAADAALQGRLSDAFHTAFIIAAGLCVLAAWAASRLPDLRFDDEMQGKTPRAL
jgi:EmrB/QacA subfamily drug resistance transporter